MPTDTEIHRKHIDAALAVIDSDMFKGLMAVDRIGKCAEMVAQALADAEREGMRRAAEIAACDCCDVCGESPGYPKCANEIAADILAEAGSEQP